MKGKELDRAQVVVAMGEFSTMKGLGWTEAEEKKMGDTIFDKMDTNKDGKVTRKELVQELIG